MSEIINGEYEEKHPNGVTKVKGYYKNGKKDGSWLEYNDNGDLILVCIFFNGKQI